MTLRQLGELRRRDQDLYIFMEEAHAEKVERIKAEVEKARSQ